MTEAEKALVDFMVDFNQQDHEEMGRLVLAVKTERIPPGAKRAWMDAFKTFRRAEIAFIATAKRIGMPDEYPLNEWRAEARAEMRNEE